MIVVETQDEFLKLIEEVPKTNAVVMPIMTDQSAHPAVNSVCALFLSVANQKYVIPFNHSEAINQPYSLLQEFHEKTWPHLFYTTSKKKLMHLTPFALGRNVIDLMGLEYLTKGSCVDEHKFYTPTMKFFYQRFYDRPNLNSIIPIVHLAKFTFDYMEYLGEFIDLELLFSEEFDFHNDTIIPACQFIESGGVCVDPTLFKNVYENKASKHIVGNLVYTEYNPYTSAGRVSNKFGGINYAAIEKEHGTRKAFISRFKTGEGSLVLIDFESFHLRLMADLMGYMLPAEPIHQYLAKQYFETDNVTPEQYEQGKKLTFRYLYSVKQEGKHIPFFASVYQFIDKVWKKGVETGFYEFATSGHKIKLEQIEDINPSKLFNYILQWYETETALGAINSIKDLYRGKKSKITLYTYDSILVDFCYDDGKEMLLKTQDILTYGGKYPVRFHAGRNYQELTNITDKLRNIQHIYTSI